MSISNNPSFMHSGRPDLPEGHPDYAEHTYPRKMFHRTLAARQVGSKIEERVLGAEWRDTPWPKEEVVHAEHPENAGIMGKPDKPAPSQPVTIPEIPTMEELKAKGLSEEDALQVQHNHMAAADQAKVAAGSIGAVPIAPAAVVDTTQDGSGHSPFGEPAPAVPIGTMKYPCGCSASGPSDLPLYCPEHGKFEEPNGVFTPEGPGEPAPATPAPAPDAPPQG